MALVRRCVLVNLILHLTFFLNLQCAEAGRSVLLRATMEDPATDWQQRLFPSQPEQNVESLSQSQYQQPPGSNGAHGLLHETPQQSGAVVLPGQSMLQYQQYQFVQDNTVNHASAEVPYFPVSTRGVHYPSFTSSLAPHPFPSQHIIPPREPYAEQQQQYTHSMQTQYSVPSAFLDVNYEGEPGQATFMQPASGMQMPTDQYDGSATSYMQTMPFQNSPPSHHPQHWFESHSHTSFEHYNTPHQHTQAPTQSAPLHRSASAGDMINQQYRQQTRIDATATHAPRHRGSISALPTHPGFGAYSAVSPRTRMSRATAYGAEHQDLSMEKEVLASPRLLHRPVLSLNTATGSHDGGATSSGFGEGHLMQRSASSTVPSAYSHSYSNSQSPVATSAASQYSDGTYRSHFSNTSSQPSLRLASSVNDMQSKAYLHNSQDSSYLASVNSSRQGSVAGTGLFAEQQVRGYPLDGNSLLPMDGRYDPYASHSSASSIPSTPELSRQQSTSSFRSPSSSDQSQSHGFFSPPPGQYSALPTGDKSIHDDEPIPELSSVRLEEKTSAIDSWARLPPRPEDDEKANNKLR